MRVPSPVEYVALDMEDREELIQAFSHELPITTTDFILQQEVNKRWGSIFEESDIYIQGRELSPLGILIFRNHHVFDVLETFENISDSAQATSQEMEELVEQGHLTQETLDSIRASEAKLITSGLVEVLQRYSVVNQHKAVEKSISRKEVMACIQKQPTRSKDSIESITSYILLNENALQHIDYDNLEEVLAVLSTPSIYQRMNIDTAMRSKLEASYIELSSPNYFVRRSMKELCNSRVEEELEELIEYLTSLSLFCPQVFSKTKAIK